MAEAHYLASRKAQYYQTNITVESNTDAGATWGAGESTLANSLKGKVNSILSALRAAKILNGGGKFSSFGTSLKAQYVQTNVADVATANSDATYAQSVEGDLLNEMKAQVNSILVAMRAARIIGGHTRYKYVNGRKTQVTQPDITSISIANADATYTSGGAGEQQLLNNIKVAVNAILPALQKAGIIL